MTTYVQVAINLTTLPELYDYHVPAELEGKIQPGSLVVVPFGRQVMQGVVWRYVSAPQVSETRPIGALLDPQPVLTHAQQQLAEWLSRHYLAPLPACIALMIPPGLSRQADTLLSLRPQALPPLESLSPIQRRLVDLLKERGPLRGAQIDAHIKGVDWRPAARRMTQRGWLEAQPILPAPTVAPRRERLITLAIPPGQIEAHRSQLGRPGTAAVERRLTLLRVLAAQREPIAPAWLFTEAGGGTSADLRWLEERGLIRSLVGEVIRDPLDHMDIPPLSEPPTLTREQQAVWQEVQTALRRVESGQSAPPHILYGITGSGKTEIYLRAVDEALKMDRQALILVPEISLTPQMVQRFAARFPGQVGVIHSKLSQGERYDTWRRARVGQLPIIIGPRSALFTPFPKLGLIVVDEFHDESFYQDELPPTYHAVEAALTLARLTNSLILLGSATPDVSLMERALRSSWRVLHLPERILAHRQAVEKQLERLGKPALLKIGEGESARLDLPPVQVVDMRQELKAGNRSIFSRALEQALEETLAKQEQAILFLNRRGSATHVFCRECGFTLRCPRCEVPLVYHADADALLCHTCGYSRKMPATCPQCSSRAIRQVGLGTERVEAEVKARFPTARVLRWDAETTRLKGTHELLLRHFSHHEADILIGTQMIAKGLDLPLVTLVGVILADIGLTLPDYRAAERGFQLLTQVAGRAGRSPLGGRVILQTYIPQHYAIQTASRHDYDGFLERELRERRRLGYPPFVRLARLELRHADPTHAREEARRMAERIQNWIEQSGMSTLEMSGPTPCFFARRAGLYRWQIILRGGDPAELLRGKPLEGWQVQIDPPSLL